MPVGVFVNKIASTCNMHLGGAIAVMCLSIVPTAVSDPSLSLLNSSGLPVALVTAGQLTL